MRRKKKHLDEYKEQNRRAAEIILQHPERYGGEGSLMMRWARAVLDQVQPTVKGSVLDTRRAA